MKNKLMVAVVGIGLVCSIALAAVVAENYVFKGQVDFDNGCIWKIAGTKVTATAAQLNSAAGGTTAALTPTSVVASEKVSSYGYTTVVGGTNNGSAVYITQAGSANANLAVLSTNTFPVTFIESPKVMWRYTAGVGVYVPTNIPTVASNLFTLVAETNIEYIAYGRIK